MDFNFGSFGNAVLNEVLPTRAKEILSSEESAGKAAAGALVKLVAKPRGNQTAAEMERGEYGRETLGIGGQHPFSEAVKKYGVWMLPAAAILAAVFILRRKK